MPFSWETWMTFFASNAVHAVVPGRSPNFVVSYDEEIGGVAGGYKAVDVEHECFVGPGFSVPG